MSRRVGEELQATLITTAKEEHPPPRPAVGAAFLAGAAILIVAGLVWFNGGLAEEAPPASIADATTTTSFETTSTTESLVTVSGISVAGIDQAIVVADIQLSDGTRIALELPKGRADTLNLAEGARVADAVIEAPTFTAYLDYDFCGADGFVNARGSIVEATNPNEVVLCRPDQHLKLLFLAGDEFTDEELDQLHLVPLAYGTRFAERLLRRDLIRGQCCFEQLGPVHVEGVMIVSNGTISGQIEALDPETLVPVWSNGIGEESFLYGAAENVVIASPGYGEIVGLDAGDGMRLWSVDLGETSVSRTRADGSGRWLATVNYGSEGDHRAPEMIAFDSLSGKVLWTTQAYAGTDWQPTPPRVIGELVVALDVPTTAETASVHGFDMETGERLWSTPLASPLEVFPSTDMILTDSQRDLLLVMTTGGTLWRIDPADGSELWRTTTGVSEFIGLSPDTVTIRRANVEIEIDLETGMW